MSDIYRVTVSFEVARHPLDLPVREQLLPVVQELGGQALQIDYERLYGPVEKPLPLPGYEPDRDGLNNITNRLTPITSRDARRRFDELGLESPEDLLAFGYSRTGMLNKIGPKTVAALSRGLARHRPDHQWSGTATPADIARLYDDVAYVPLSVVSRAARQLNPALRLGHLDTPADTEDRLAGLNSAVRERIDHDVASFKAGFAAAKRQAKQ